MRLSDRLDLSFEMGFRLLFTDHVDDVGGLYPDIRDLESELAKTMFDRSGETTSASGDSRQTGIDAITPVVGGFSDQYGYLDESGQLADPPLFETDFQRLASYGIGGLKRGNTPAENDMYIVTGFHLNYILTTKRYPRYHQNRNTFRRGRR